MKLFACFDSSPSPQVKEENVNEEEDESEEDEEAELRRTAAEFRQDRADSASAAAANIPQCDPDDVIIISDSDDDAPPAKPNGPQVMVFNDSTLCRNSHAFNLTANLHNIMQDRVSPELTISACGTLGCGQLSRQNK